MRLVLGLLPGAPHLFGATGTWSSHVAFLAALDLAFLTWPWLPLFLPLETPCLLCPLLSL